ncbi:uncharacterized protein LOC142242852 [Haematobia irritans]|uniref:uncharacterized protein LOC142242852 n=1 Tax=Haematobia irritans TaxID=7368 RepID=UPI003F4F576C
MAQFFRTERKLMKTPDIKAQYNQTILEYLELGHTNYYLPHHARSLNDNSFTGPILQQDLVLQILKWRFFKYVYSADVTKMYRQILLDKNQTQYQQDVADTYPLASKIIRENLYVDDVLAGAHTVEDAIKSRKELLLALDSAGFQLMKWSSNNHNVIQDLPSEQVLPLNWLDLSGDSSTKTLGVRWNISGDYFTFNQPTIDVRQTTPKEKFYLLLQNYLTHVDEIYGCCDAFESAYGAALYIRVELQDHKVETHLIAAKTRVAPIKKISLPRLELRGAVLLSKLASTTISNLQISNYSTQFWRDSTIFWRNTGQNRSHLRISTEEITPEEIQETKRRLLIMTQSQYLAHEYTKLVKNIKISSTSSLLTMNPFIYSHGVMRSNGRLVQSPVLSYNERHPILLPYDARFTQLLVEFTHKVTLHGGNQLMTRVLRSEFWIFRLKPLVKKVIHNCKTCILFKRHTQSQIMASLPPERTFLSRPFTNTGVDFAGPFNIKNYKTRVCLKTKGYICIIRATYVSYVHMCMEVTSDLSSQSFLAAFSRFIARRGCPSCIYSDNGKNFTGAAELLRKDRLQFLKTLQTQTLQLYSHNNLVWKCIPPGASHMGGFWEAGVKSLKTHLRKFIPSMSFTFEELSTILARIEACLNSRPLHKRYETVERRGYCRNCLARSHLAPDCKSLSGCRQCNLRHHTLLHGAPQLEDPLRPAHLFGPPASVVVQPAADALPPVDNTPFRWDLVFVPTAMVRISENDVDR